MTFHAPIFTIDQFNAEMVPILPSLHRFALSLTRSATDADDLLQDTCTAALTKWQQYDPTQPLDRWLFRVLRNLWVTEIRKRKVRIGKGNVPAELASELRVECTHETIIAAAQARARMAEMCPKLRTPLLLVCEEGYSYREASDLLNIPIGTVMSRVHRARKEIAETLAFSAP